MKKNWRRIPYVFLLAIFWFAMKMSEANMSAGSFLGIVLIITCICVILLEFVKSMDIGIRSFMIDNTLSVSTTVFTVFIFAKCVTLGNLCFADIMLGITVLVDALLSPVNSFSMALRNLSGNVGTKTNEEAL